MYTLRIFVFRGELDDARHWLAVQRELTDLNEFQDMAHLRLNEGLVLLAEGDAAGALQAAEVGLKTPSVWLGDALDLALNAAFASGDDAKIDELLGTVEDISPGQSTPTIRALGARFAARRAAKQGSAGIADQGFAAAAGLYRQFEAPFELGVVLLEHAEWLAGEDRADEIAPLVAEARKIFERLRVPQYLERLGRLGVREPAAAN